MRLSRRLSFGLVVLALVTSGCYGPFNLTRRLYNWNSQIGTKWEREFMFILLAWAPVYGLAVLGDAIVFNSMEFWTGNNPVDPPGARRGALPQTKRLVRDDEEALLTYANSPDGASLLIEQFRRGQPAGSLRLERRGALAVASDAEGRILFTASTQPDGRVVVHNAGGRQVAAALEEPSH